MLRPNFDEVRIIGDQVVVQGTSDEVDDIASIRAILAQEGNSDGGPGVFVEDIEGRARARGVDTLWQVEIPIGNFKVGPAVAFGVEQRKENFLMITWAQAVQIIG